MADKREYPSRRKSTAGIESSALRSERASSKTKTQASTARGSRGHHNDEAAAEPSHQYSSRTEREGNDAQTLRSGYNKATAVPALEYFPATLPNAPPKPQPSASAHLPHAVPPTLQHVPTLPDETAPPSDTDKNGKGKHSKRKSSRRRCSSAGKHSYDARSSTSSASQRVTSEKDRDHSVPARHGSPEPHTCRDVEEQPTASSVHAIASKRRRSLKPKKNKGTRLEDKEVSHRSASVISDHAINDGRYERQNEERNNALATKGDGADNESQAPQKPGECSSTSLPGIPTDVRTPGRVAQQAKESAVPLQAHASGVLTKGSAARADDVTIPGSAKENARTGNADQQSNVIEDVPRPVAEPKITTTSALCINIFALCVAAASITLIFVSYSDNTEEVACIAPRCLAVRGDLYGLLNASADPCINFYDHVCGHWHDRESGGSFRGDNVKAAQVKLQEAIASSRHENYETEGASVLSQVYTACERYMATETTLTEVLQAADTLLSLSTLRQADSNAEVAGFLMRTSIETGLQSMVIMMIIRDSAEEPLYVAPSSTLTKRFVRNEEAKDTTASDNDSWRFLLQLLEAFPDVQNVTSVAQLLYWLDADLSMVLDLPHKSVLERTPLDVAFERLVDGVSVAQWMKAANMFLPAWRALGRRGTVLIRSAQIVKKVFGVLFSKGVKTAALYVSAYVASYVATMERDKHRVRSGETTVAWSCLNRASECLTKTWPQLVSKLVESQGSVRILEDMFVAIKKASTYPKVFTWLGEKSRALANQEVDETSAVIQEPIDQKVNYSGLDIAGSEQATDGLLFTRSDTYEDYSFVVKYLLARRHDQKVRMVSPPTLREIYAAGHGYVGDVSYSRRVGVLVVPGLYQTAPYTYDSDVPAYFNYGTVGALLASQVAIMMHPNYAGFRYASSWWARDTHDQYSRRIRCLVDLHYRLGFKDHVAGSPQEQQATMYTVVQGLRLAFDSMAMDFREHAPNYGVFSAYWPEAIRIFFMRYCLLWCNAAQRPSPLTPREMCLLAVHNMPEFAEAFGCLESARYVRGHCRM